MFKTMFPIALLAAALVTPSVANAYGAAHVGYTHVGPNGVYHTGETVAHGPGGTAATGHTTAYGAGGASYHSGSAGAVTPTGAGGVHYSTGTTSGYHYAPSYSGGTTTGGAYRYGYVR